MEGRLIEICIIQKMLHNNIAKMMNQSNTMGFYIRDSCRMFNNIGYYFTSGCTHSIIKTKAIMKIPAAKISDPI